MLIKFFPKDVVKGKAKKVGDNFTAKWFNSTAQFVIVSHHGDFFMCERV